MACQRHYRGAKVDRAPALSECQILSGARRQEAVILRSTEWSRCNHVSRGDSTAVAVLCPDGSVGDARMANGCWSRLLCFPILYWAELHCQSRDDSHMREDTVRQPSRRDCTQDIVMIITFRRRLFSTSSRHALLGPDVPFRVWPVRA